jgi:hypothetical protein
MHSVFSKECIIICTNDSIRYHYKKLLYGPQNTKCKAFIVLKQEVYNPLTIVLLYTAIRTVHLPHGDITFVMRRNGNGKFDLHWVLVV